MNAQLRELIDELVRTCGTGLPLTLRHREVILELAALAAPKEAGAELTDDPSEQRPARAWMESTAVKLGLHSAAREPTLTLARALSDWIDASLAAPSKEAGPAGEFLGWVHECVWKDGTSRSLHQREPKLMDAIEPDGSPLAGLVSQRIVRVYANPPGDQRQEGMQFSLGEAKSLVAFFGGNNTEVTVQKLPERDVYRNGAEPLPAGKYAWCTEYPEEGCMYLGPHDPNTDEHDDSAASPRPEAAAAVGLRAEVARIAGDYLPDSDKDAPLALQEMRNALLAALASPTPQPASADVDGVALIAAERQRQVSVEGWTPEHDAEHGDGEMAQAAACYALPPNYRVFVEDEFAPQDWPWDRKWWKPQDRVHDLTRAGALIAAEIDRLLATGARQ